MNFNNPNFLSRGAILALLLVSGVASAERIRVVDSSVAFRASDMDYVYSDDDVVIFRDGKKLASEEPLYTIRAPKKTILNEIVDQPGVKLEGAISGTVVLRIPDSYVDRVSELLHHEGGGMGCGALIRVPEEQPSSFRPTDSFREELATYPDPKTYETQVKTLLAEVKKENLVQSVTKLGDFFTRHHASSQSKASNQWIKASMENGGKVQVKEFNHRNTNQTSIIATLPGQTDEVVVLGAHIDSIRGSGGDPDTRRAPGQDDDGSGTASVIEALRVLAQSGMKFKRTIHVMGYAAEEVGLVGSNEIAEDFANRNVKVRAKIQIDMAGYLKAGDPVKIYFVSNGTTPEMTDYAGKLVETFIGVPWEKKRLSFGTSDHRSWFSRGYPAIFPTENPDAFNFNLHTENDTIDKLNFDLMSLYVKLALAFVVNMAEPI